MTRGLYSCVVRVSLTSSIVALLVIPVPIQKAAAAPVFSSVVSFGDSLNDAGNVHVLTSGPPYHPDPPAELGYFNGRATNGPNWVDFVADGLGVAPPQASLNGGTNYAYAGAKTGFGTNSRFPSPTYPLNPPLEVNRVGTQIASFIADHTSFQSSQLVLLWAGANDLRDVQSPADILALVDNLEAHIRALATAGATTVVVPNQADFSLAPFFSGNPVQQAQVLAVVTAFNTLLDLRLHALRNDPSLGGVDLVDADIFALSRDVTANPAAYGFSNVTDPVVTFGMGGFTVGNPAGYLFYDIIHPTSQFHSLIAETVVTVLHSAQIPEPGTLPLMGFGAVILALCRKRKSRNSPAANTVTLAFS